MTITEAIEQIKKDGKYTDENVSDLKEAVLETVRSDIHGSYVPRDVNPKIQEFYDFTNKMDYDDRIQDIVNSVISVLASVMFP